MKNFRFWSGPICRLLVLSLVFLQFPVGVAKASLIPTERLLEAGDVQKERQKILSFMDREDVRDKLVSYGVDPQEARERVRALSNSEVKTVAAEIDKLPAGQGTVGTIAVIILIVFLVLLFTDMIGATDVFPFVKKARSR